MVSFSGKIVFLVELLAFNYYNFKLPYLKLYLQD